jgi:hypothetical protein
MIYKVISGLIVRNYLGISRKCEMSGLDGCRLQTLLLLLGAPARAR